MLTLLNKPTENPGKNDRGYISYHEEGKWLVFTTHNGKITEIKLFDYVV